MALGKVFAVTMSAGVAQTFPGGQFFRVMEANAALTIEFFSPDGQPIGEFTGILGGFGVNAEKFGRQRQPGDGPINTFGTVRITSATTQDIDFAVSSVPIDYDRLTGTITTTQASGTTIDSVPDVSLAAATTTVISAADANRRALIVRNISTNPSTFRIGDSGAAAANGIELAPGESITLDTQAAVYGFNPHATTAQSVNVLSLKD